MALSHNSSAAGSKAGGGCNPFETRLKEMAAAGAAAAAATRKRRREQVEAAERKELAEEQGRERERVRRSIEPAWKAPEPEPPWKRTLEQEELTLRSLKATQDIRKKFKGGQKHPTPPTSEATRAFYTSLFEELPESKVATKFIVEHGILPVEKHEVLLRRYERLKEKSGFTIAQQIKLALERREKKKRQLKMLADAQAQASRHPVV